MTTATNTTQELYTIHLIRHGFSVGNRDELYAGHTDVPLTDEGRAELREFRSSLPYPRGDRYFHSDLSRAAETMEILYPEVREKKAMVKFRELCFGNLEGQPNEAFDVHVFFENWLLERDQGFEEESLAAVSARGVEACYEVLRELREHQEHTAVVTCHAIVTRSIIHAFEKGDVRQFFSFPAANGKGYSLFFRYQPEAVNSFEFVKAEGLFQ